MNACVGKKFNIEVVISESVGNNEVDATRELDNDRDNGLEYHGMEGTVQSIY